MLLSSLAIMPVTMVREAWTDERLDDLADRMDRGFDRARSDTNRGFDRVDRDIRDVRGEIGELRGEMHARFDAMYRTMVYGGCGIIGAVVASIAATLLT